MSKRGAFGRGQDVGEELWDWRWLFVALLVLAVLGKVMEAVGLI